MKKIKLENARTDIDKIIKDIKDKDKEEIEEKCKDFLEK